MDREGDDGRLGAGIDSLEDLSRALRQLRRRHARQHGDTGLSYREIAAQSGYAHGVIGDYFTGKILPPTDRLDVLVVLLGATGEEQSAFATARDRIEEGRRQPGKWAGGVAAATRTLPHDIASFIGREAELRQLADAVDAGGVVGIHAIGGMAGIGKTAFAVHAAHQLAGRFPDGQIFVPLHGHTPGQRPVDPADALASLLLTAGLGASRVPPGLEPRSGMWRDYLAGKRLLLLLDDAAGHEQVRPLLPGTSGSLVLITSRRHLTALEDARAISLDTLPADEAAGLLARLADRPDLDPGDAAVRHIARLCGYLPLAIAMLARQFHHHLSWTADGLAAKLAAARDRLELMHAENLSVAAAFDLSYLDLAPDHQRLFRRLGLHPGTDIDAYAAAALNATSVATASLGLDALYDQYLLAEPAQGRYRFHDLIREHARTLAATDPPAERDAAVDRILDYYLHTASTASQYLARRTSAVTVTPPAAVPGLPGREEAVTWMDAERLNLHAAASYAAASERLGHAIAIPAAINGYLLSQGHWDQALTLHRTALSAARAASDRPAEAGALNQLGIVQRLTGDLPAAIASFTLALELCCDLGDRSGEADARNELGVVQCTTGDYPAAIASLNRAVTQYRGLGDRSSEASALNDLGVVQLAAGRYPAAAASFTRALEAHRRLGDRLWEANALNNIGAVQRLTGDYPAAAGSHTQALELYRDLGNRFGEANALNELGIVQRLTGESPAAARNHAQALELYRDLGHRTGEARALNELGIVQCLTGSPGAAASSLAQALELYRDLGSRSGEAEVLNSMGELALASAAPAEAAARHEQALAIAAAIASPMDEARALEGLGRCSLRGGQTAEGTARLAQAMAIYQRLGSPHARRLEIVLDDDGA